MTVLLALPLALVVFVVLCELVIVGVIVPLGETVSVDEEVSVVLTVVESLALTLDETVLVLVIVSLGVSLELALLVSLAVGLALLDLVTLLEELWLKVCEGLEVMVAEVVILKL